MRPPLPAGSPVQSCPDPAVYGVVQSGDHVGRTCMVKWFKLRPSGDDVEVSGCCPHVSFRVGSGGLDVGPLRSRPPILSQLIGEEEDVSVYDIADHPDFRFRTTDIVIRIGNTEDGGPHREDEVPAPWPCVSCSTSWCHQVAPGAKTCKSFGLRVHPKRLPQESGCRQWGPSVRAPARGLTCLPGSGLVHTAAPRAY